MNEIKEYQVTFVYNGSLHNDSDPKTIKHNLDYEVKFYPIIEGITATRSNQGLPDLVEYVLSLAKAGKFDIKKTKFHLKGNFSRADYILVGEKVSEYKNGKKPTKIKAEKI